MISVKDKSHLSVGLIGKGSKVWIAGVNYISSLLFANTLLPDSQQIKYTLFLHEDNADLTYFKDVIQYTDRVNYFDFFYGVTFPLLQRLDQTFRRATHNRKFPRRIKNNLPKLLNDTDCHILFPANKLLSNRPSSIKKISWIPDFQYKYFPEYFTHPRRLEYSTRKTFRLSDLVVVSNECAKNDVQQFFPEYSAKIRVIPFTMWLGPEWKSKDHLEIIKKYELPRKYLIFPSQFWIHKNHRYLFETIAAVKSRGFKDIKLVCTGYIHDYRNPRYKGELDSIIEKQGLRENIHILGLLPRYDQIQLMRGAAAIVQPSLYEGYSALLDEAKSLGKEIFVSDIPMHREQQSEEVTYFSIDDPMGLADLLETRWPNLNPGPNLSLEKLAIINYAERMKVFGNCMRDIFYSVL